jgi:hypothetical protein
MRWLTVTVFLGLTVMFGAALTTPSARAQVDSCSALVARALQAVDQNCGQLGRNSACYGFNQVNATFAAEMPPDFFSAPADIAELLMLRGLFTTPLDIANDTWGVAVIKAQANLPSTLPGQAVTFLLMGGAQVEDTVAPENVFVPGAILPVTTAAEADMHSGANTSTTRLARVPAGTPLNADAISADGVWVRAATNFVGGWLPISALAPVDLAALSVMPDAPAAPMQAFTFETRLDALTCAEAPNTILVQGPQGFEITLNVNGAQINVNSTVQLISMPEAPERILNTLPLPPDIIERLRNRYGEQVGDEVCRIQHLRVISGYARLNSGTILPAGNAAWSAYCLRQPNLEPPTQAPRATDSSTGGSAIQPPASAIQPPDSAAIQPRQIGATMRQQVISFISEWGSFREVSEAEWESIALFERLPENILNYPIKIPGG